MRKGKGKGKAVGPGRIVTVVLACGLSGLPHPSAADRTLPMPTPATPESPALSPAAAAAVQKRLAAAALANEGYGGSILRVESLSRGLLWQGAAGPLAHGREAALAPEDAFEVASIAKMFTAVCTLLLVEDGQLTLDEPLGRILPPADTRGLLVVEGHDYGPELTIEQLLSHRAGLPDYWTDPPLDRREQNEFLRAFLADARKLWSPAEVLGYARRLTPVARPGTQYHYSDTGYLLLGLVIERVSHRSLEAVFRQRLFTPLQMNDTYSIYREPAPRRRRLAHRYEEKADLFHQKRQSAEWAAGGVVSIVEDLSRFLRALSAGRLFRNHATRDRMLTWRPTGAAGTDYGLGLFRLALGELGGHAWGHDGHGNAFAYILPEHDLLVVGTLDQLKNDWLPLVLDVVRALESPVPVAGRPSERR